jgi:hypothetical protein
MLDKKRDYTTSPPMLRHSVLWIMRDPLSTGSRRAMLQRLAFLGTECPSVSSGDYGADLFGGSEVLHEVRPSQRVPVWRRSADGPVCNYDMALHLDFEDWDAFQDYAVDPTHDDASRANEAENWDEVTARCDWYYDGDAPPTHARLAKHVAMFIWDEAASEAARRDALAAAEALGETDEVDAAMTGHNVGKSTTAYDWILDLLIPDEDAAGRLLESAAYERAMATVAAATHFEWTARMTHVMHRP